MSILYHDYKEEKLQSLYCPGLYQQGQAHCLHMLEHHNPECQTTILFLVLYLAAQDKENEALELLEILEVESLFRVLSNLPFGQGTEAESVLYETIANSLTREGFEGELSQFLSQGTCSVSSSDEPLFDELLIGV